MRWLRRLFRKRALDDQLDSELRFHVEQQIADNISAGMPPAEARRRALAQFGGLEFIKEETRDARGTHFVGTLFQDIRFALRMLRKSPGFTAVAVLTLALGIGANTAIFSAVNGILLEPLLYAYSSRLITVDLLSLPKIRAIQEQSTAFGRMAIYRRYSTLILGGEVPVQGESVYVSDDFFPLLGVKPLLGRPILPEDTQPGHALVAVLSYHLWMDEFGEDAHIVGKEIRVAGGDETATNDEKPAKSKSAKAEPSNDENSNKSKSAEAMPSKTKTADAKSAEGQRYTVIGVMPKGFNLGVNWGGGEAQEGLWMPFVYSPSDRDNLGSFSSFVARLKNGVTLGQAEAQLKAISSRLAAEHPKEYPRELRGYGTIVTAGINGPTDPVVRLALLILMGAVGFVLLMACVNVAALFVARSWTRQQELTIRRALGATRLRIVCQLLSESLLLAAVSGALGLLFSTWGIRLIRAMAPPYTPRVDYIRLDANLVWFTLGISLFAAILAGLAPALHATSRRVGATLRGGLSGSFAGVTMGKSHRFRNTLVVLEVALAMIVVVGGALMARSFHKLITLDTGVHANNVITMSVRLSESVCNGKNWDTACLLAGENIFDGIRALPGVQKAALSTVGGPLRGGWVTTSFDYPGKPRGVGLYVDGERGNQLTSGNIVGKSVTPDFFAALGMRILKGHDFGLKDLNNSRVAIVSESFARKYIPGNPLGRRFSTDEDNHGHHQWMQVIGVVNDVRDRAVNEFASGPMYYTPMSLPGNRLTVIVRAAANPASMAPAIERIVRSVDKDAPITNIQTVDQIIAQSAAAPRFQTLLLGSFGVLGLLLAIIGTYGVISYAVVQRTHEIGVRMTLGAQPSDIVRMVLGEGLVLAFVGIGIGVAGALALTRFLRSLLFEIRPTDPVTFIGVAVLLALVALLACYIPARRAMRVDPMVALRYE